MIYPSFLAKTSHKSIVPFVSQILIQFHHLLQPSYPPNHYHPRFPPGFI